MTIIYVGPGNVWNVIGKSKLTGKKEQLSGISFRSACQFMKAHGWRD